MITMRTKVQLAIFVAITLVGVSFVGARYAGLDRLVLDTSYKVTAHFADSGGVFTGAEVTYRGVTIGRVSSMELTDEGVDVLLNIEKDNDDIPADTRALVGNRSAVGEQYVELQPQANGKPYLKSGSEIEQSKTATPISTTEWLDNTQKLVNSVPKGDLRTVVSEFGAAFKGTGEDLGTLIDSSNSFIAAANDNFDLTRRLVRDSRVVLGTQLDKASAIRSFSRNLRLFSQTMVKADGSLRKVIDNGGATATTLRAFLEDNKVDLGKLFNNLVTVNAVQIKHLDGLRMVLITYPYVVAGGYAVIDKSDSTGKLDAHFGLILTEEPAYCSRGYGSTNRRSPKDGSNAPMNMKARCTESPAQSNARGAQNKPGRAVPGLLPHQMAQPGVDVPVIGSYDRETGEFEFFEDPETESPQVGYTGGAAASFGDQSWKWLLMQPVMR